jgi:hypothetical protein
MFFYLIGILRHHNEAKQLDEVIHKLNLNDNKKSNFGNNNSKSLNFDLDKYILICPQF